MKQIKFMQNSAQGKIDGTMRFIGKTIYLKVNNSQYLDKMIKEMEAKGVRILKGRGWLQINLFGDNKMAKLGPYEFDFENDSAEIIERNLSSFYATQYRKGGFIVIEGEMQHGCD